MNIIKQYHRVRYLCIIVLFSYASSGLGLAHNIQLIDNKSFYNCIIKEIRESNSQVYRVHFSINALKDEIIRHSEQSYHKLTFDDFLATNLIGEPEFPMVSQIIAIPSNTTYQVKLLEEKWDTLSIGNIFPAQKPLNGIENPDFQINNHIYADSLYNPELLRVSGKMTMMNIENITVHVCPFKYYPSLCKLAVLKDFTLEVNYSRDYPVYDSSVYVGNNSFIPSIFDNFAETEDISRNTNDYSGYDYLIIGGGNIGLIYHGEIISQKLKDFIKWKAFRGHRVAVTTTQTIGTSCDDIKSYITNFAHNNPTLKYVLFMGDEDVIPLKTSISPYQSRTVKGGFWYGCLDGDADYQAEIAIGRFPSNSITELENMMDKSIKYERDYKTYLNQNLLVAGWRYSSEFDSYYVFRRTTDYIYDTTYNESMSFMKAYGGQSTPLQGGTDATNDTIIKHINNGVNIIAYSGHGMNHAWGDWNYLSQNFGNNEIDSLADDKCPVFISNACSIGNIASTLYPCMLETFMRSNNGATAFIGAKETSMGSSGDEYLQRFFKFLLNSSVYNIGLLNIATHNFNIPTFYTEPCMKDFALHCICGADPSLELWTSVPKEFADISVSTTSDSLMISTNEIDTFTVSVVSEMGELIKLCPVVNNLFTDTVPTDNAYYYIINRHNFVPYIIKFDSKSHFIQNTTFDIDAYYTGTPLSIGYDVTDTVNYGNVIVNRGHNLTIERGVGVTINNGFSVEQGATLQIK